MMRKTLPILALLLFSLLIGQALHDLRNGFTLRRIPPLNRPVSADWDEQTAQILSQPFHYLGRGRQCFAFESEDKKYVLKFPRTDIYKTPFWARVLPAKTYREKLEAIHKVREQFILDSFSLSFRELKHQTALLAFHLGQSEPRGKKLTLIDRIGFKYQIPLENAPFVLQEKKPLLMEAFTSALEKGEKKEAEKILDALISVIVERAEKGILNRDRSFLRNYGYDGENAYQIDVGSFFKNPNLSHYASYEKSLRDSLDPIQEWLAENEPSLLPHLNTRLSSALNKKL